MVIETLKALFARDLDRLRKEIELYEHEDELWKTVAGISNSAGNLCLHLIGNLNTYIGKEIGHTSYIRQRALEFSLKNIPKIELLKRIDETALVVSNSLDQLSEEELTKMFPVLVFDTPTSTVHFLIHLTTHLSYHLGQINYHRRLLSSSSLSEGKK